MVEITKEEKEFFDKVEPIGENIIIKRDVFKSKIITVISEDKGKHKPQGVVVSVSPNCKLIKVGDIVAWSSMTPLQVIHVEEFKEDEDTRGNYVTTSENYLVYKFK
jgi:co-chaperonin GroES (HSP10)